MDKKNNEVLNTDEVLIMQGGAIKARGRESKSDGRTVGKVGGVLCRFTNADSTDWYGDFFDESTDFRFIEGMPCAVYFDHGCNGLIGVKVFGVGKLTKGAEGIEITDVELDLSDPDSLALYERVEKDELGWSSGTAGHLVKRTQVKTYALHGESAYRIDHWPLGLDASLTPYPAEDRNRATTIKSIKSRSVKSEEKPLVEDKPEVDNSEELKSIQLQAIKMCAQSIKASINL
jgi:hypothetical protein